MAFDYKFYISSVKERAAGTVAAVKKKASDAASVAKANYAIHTEQTAIKKAQLELGEMYYRDYADGMQMDISAYEAVCERIAESNRRIAELRESIGIAESVRAGEVEIDPDDITDDDFVKVGEE